MWNTMFLEVNLTRGKEERKTEREREREREKAET
jgi:hypothetical protein